MPNPKGNPNWGKGHKKVGGRKKGSGSMSIEEFRKIVLKVNPEFIKDYILLAKKDSLLARSIMDRLVPIPKDTTAPVTIIIKNYIPDSE